MDYNEICRYLDSLGQFNEGTGVERGRKLLNIIGNPEKELKVIHVAGTNGKGSVCSYIESCLRNEGYKVGLFTSPHLNTIRERIQINRELISEEDFTQYFNKIYAASGMNNAGLAYFDFFFGIAMLYFKEQNVDYVVLETGLGGKLDATNAVERPICSVITAIMNQHLYSKNYGTAGAISVLMFLLCAVLCVIIYFTLTQEDDGLTREQRKAEKARIKAAKAAAKHH